jgi:DNA repair protein RecO (recombination protein O)
MSTTFRDLALVLGSRPSRDSDRTYALYTKAHGKVVAVARGSRKPKSKLGPHLSAIGEVDVMVARGAHVDHVAGTELAHAFHGIHQEPWRMGQAQKFLRLLDRLTRRDSPDERVYGLAVDFLRLLDKERVPASASVVALSASALREQVVAERPLVYDAATFQLLDSLGFGMELAECVGCRRPLVPEGNHLNVLAGGVECVDCADPLARPISAACIKVLRYFRNEPMGHVHFLHLDDRLRREVEGVVDLLVAMQTSAGKWGRM